MGVLTADGASSLLLEDAVVRGTVGGDVRGWMGQGLHVQAGGRIEARRVLVEDSQQEGAQAIQEGSTLVLEDVVIRRTARDRDGWYGTGLGATSGPRSRPIGSRSPAARPSRSRRWRRAP